MKLTSGKVAINISLLSNALKNRVSKVLTMKFLLLIDRLPLRLLFTVFSIAYLILTMNLPVSIYTGAMHDDALFWWNAYHILQGDWLGSYTQMTLAKGPGFPLFLTANAILGVPVTLSIALLYIFACVLIANTLRDLGINKYFVLTIFAIILFHPALFPVRIIRDNIYPALSLIIISGAIRLIFAPLPQDLRLVRIVPYGLALGLFWITREEGVWIIPGLMILLLLKIFQLRNQNFSIKEVVTRFTFFTLVAAVFVSSIALINYHNYGKFEVVDFKGNAYSNAVKSLNSVDVRSELRYLPVSFAKRQEIYKVSPTFAQLKDFFEVTGKGWTSPGCAIYSWTCGDYAGGWFAWALRDAVASKGYYESPVRAAEFYKSITKEIETACYSGIIKCRTNPVPFMPNITITQLEDFPGKLVEAIKLAMVQLPVSQTGGPSWEPLTQLEKTRLLLRNPLTTAASEEQKINLSGWFYSTSRDWLVMTCSYNDKSVKKDIERVISQDIAAYYKNPNANYQRFSINVQIDENCSISTDSLPENKLTIYSLLGKQKTTIFIGEHGTLYLDDISETNKQLIQVLPLKIKNSLANLYKLIVPIVVILGALAYLMYFIWALSKRAPITDIFIASTMLWCLVFSRIFIIILVDISSFPAINALYMSAAFPILCLAALLSLQLVSTNKTKQGVFHN